MTATPSAPSRARRAGLTFILFAAMGAATFPPLSIGIVASFIIDDLGIERAELGLVIAANALLAAALSPAAGRITDAVGGKRAVIGVFAIAAASFAVFGVAQGLTVLFLGSILGAWSQAGGNPATNKLVAAALPPGERGVVTGIKQSGVQMGTLVGGLTLPSLAIALGWRGMYLVVATLPLLLSAVAAMIVPTAARPVAQESGARGRMPSAVGWLTGYGFLLGFAGAVVFLVPLFAEEALGFDPRLAGVAAATIGFTAFVARIGWARSAENRNEYRWPLLAMAAIAALSAIVMAVAPLIGAWVLWVGVVLIGVSSSAWNSVGMLAVINVAGREATGRASGLVLLGFLAGLGLGPPIYGAIADRFGYEPLWWLSAAVAAAGAVVVAVWRAKSAAVSD